MFGFEYNEADAITVTVFEKLRGVETREWVAIEVGKGGSVVVYIYISRYIAGVSCARECGSFVRCARGLLRPRSIARYCRARAALARNLRPRATSNRLLIEYLSNSGNISHHFASHAAAVCYLRYLPNSI